MSEIKRFIGEMFQEDNGGYSMLRILIVACYALVFVVWAYVCIRTKAVIDLPGGVVTVLMGELTAKVWQKREEKRFDPINQNPNQGM